MYEPDLWWHLAQGREAAAGHLIRTNLFSVVYRGRCSRRPRMAFARERGLAGPAFTSLNLGGFVAWELYPSALVFQDARLQAYPASHFRGVMDASRSREGRDAITGGVDWAVLSLPRVNELSGVGQFDPVEWGSAFRDDAIEIVVRRSGRYGALAAPRL